MHRAITGAAVAVALLVGMTMPSFAFERDPGFVAKLYWKIPFAPGAGKTTRSLGFTMDHARLRPQSDLLSSAAERPPIAELRFGETGLQAFDLGGLNVLERVVTLNAQGEPETESRVNWRAIGTGVVLVGIVGALIAIPKGPNDKCAHRHFFRGEFLSSHRCNKEHI